MPALDETKVGICAGRCRLLEQDARNRPDRRISERLAELLLQEGLALRPDACHSDSFGTSILVWTKNTVTGAAEHGFEESDFHVVDRTIRVDHEDHRIGLRQESVGDLGVLRTDAANTGGVEQGDVLRQEGVGDGDLDPPDRPAGIGQAVCIDDDLGAVTGQILLADRPFTSVHVPDAVTQRVGVLVPEDLIRGDVDVGRQSQARQGVYECGLPPLDLSNHERSEYASFERRSQAIFKRLPGRGEFE